MLPGDSKEMNENIKNLWDAALEEFSKEHQFATIMLPEPLKEKFARLIVQECGKVIVNGGYRNPALGEKLPLTPPEIAQMIKEHFGVEE